MDNKPQKVDCKLKKTYERKMKLLKYIYKEGDGISETYNESLFRTNY